MARTVTTSIHFKEGELPHKRARYLEGSKCWAVTISSGESINGEVTFFMDSVQFAEFCMSAIEVLDVEE